MDNDIGSIINSLMSATVVGQQDHMYLEMIDKGYKLTVSVAKLEVENEEE